jgi:hypothetical protein
MFINTLRKKVNVTLFETCSHVIIITRKVDPHAEGGVRILITESSIKAIEMLRVLEKARLIYSWQRVKHNLQPFLYTVISVEDLRSLYRNCIFDGSAHESFHYHTRRCLLRTLYTRRQRERLRVREHRVRP